MRFNNLALAVSTALDDIAIKGSKGGKTPRKAVESPDSLKSIALARIIDAVSEGEIEGFASGNDPELFLQDVYYNETPVQNADGTRNFKNVQVDARLGTQDQPYIKGFPAVENELGINVALLASAPWTRSFTNLQLSAVNIRLAVSALSKTNTENGDITGTSVSYAIDVATDGGAFQTVMSSAFTGKSSGPYERTHRIDLPTATTSGWIVRVRRLSPDTGTAYIQDETSVVSVTEIIDGKFRYPMTALISTQIDASQFQAIPTRAFHLKGRRIKVPVNYDPVTGVYTGVWNGTFKTAYSNNPAWVFYDLATNPRYGLGHLVQELVIDKWSLYAIGQYCDEIVPDGFGGTERRMTCNLYLQQQGDAFKVLGDLTSVFRGICYWTGGSIVPVADRPTDPVYTYTNANVVNGSFKYEGSSIKARHSAVIVSWNDMSDFGRLKNDYYEDPESMERYGFQLTTIVAMGCTSRGQAQRLAKWILYSERLLTNSVTFSVGLDGTYAAPGQIVRIADKHRAGRRIGGRLVSATGSTAVLDSWAVATPPLIGDAFTVILPTGVSETRIISGTNPGTKTITVSTPFTSVPVQESVWAVDSNDLKTQLYRVLGVVENDDGSYGITALQHNPSLFDAVDLGEPIEVPDISVIASPIQQRPTSVTITGVERAGYVLTMPLLTARWPAVANAQSYRVQWRKDAGEWTPVQEVSGLTADYQSPFPGDYECKVSAVNALGIVSVPQTSAVFTLTDPSTVPGFVDELNADIAEALETAENAAAIADGAVVSFWQPSPPTIGSGPGEAKVGDIWFDTNDGNRIWRVVGSAWVDAQDDQLALALAAATTAQATADGKVKTFFQNTAPTATAIGDLWFNTTVGVKKLFRWNGSTWSDEIADVTLDQLGGSGVNLLPDQYSTLESTTIPAVTSFGLSIQRVASAGNFKFSTGAWLLARTGVGTTEGYFYLGNGLNVPRTPGKKYLVSFYYKTPNAGMAGTHDLYVWDGANPHIGSSGWTCVADNTWRRAEVLLDPTTYTSDKIMFRIDFDTAVIGADIVIDGIMVEEMVGRKVAASTYTRGTANSQALSALIAAQSAQATADGSIDIYRQSAAPTVAKFGDYWQDSDDGKWYFNNSGTSTPSWIESTDNRLPTAITNAANAQSAANTAQSTANARIRLFVQDATPSAGSYIVGDMWYRPSYKDTYYWNGTGWSKNADTFEAATDSLVFNPSFEQADLYWNRDTGMYTEANAAALNGSRIMVFSASLGNPNARAVNQKSFSVRPGQVVSVIGSVGRWQNLANGAAAIGLVFYNKDGAFIGEKNIAWSTAPSTGQQADAYWRTVTGKITVPYGAVKANANMIVTSCTAGFWVFDNIRLAFTDDQPRAVSSGESFVPNGNFGQNFGQFPIAQYLPVAGEFVADGWVNDSVGGTYTSAVSVGLEAYASGNQMQLFIGDAGGTASPGSNQVYVRSGDRFTVEPGEKFIVRSEGVVDIGTAKPAGIDIFTYCGLNFYNKDGADIGYGGRQALNQAGYWLTEHLVTIPAGTAYVRPIVGVQWNNTTGGNVAMPWATTHARFRMCQIRRQTNLDQNQITDGTTYGRTANQDLYDFGGVRRIGVNVKGSRKILGGARNSRASLVAGIPSVRSTTALSATSAGAVSVAAHNLEVNGETITYNAVSNAITGLSQSVTYTIYTLDPFLDGGTRTFYAQTSVLSTQQAGEGAVLIGLITIPTSGGSTGGGGGTGNPGDWCVAVDSFLPDGTYAADIKKDMMLACYNENPDNPNIRHLRVEKNEIADADCLRMITESGASIVASKTTPMTLRDGSCVMLPEMLGREAVVYRLDGTFRWERVVLLQEAGVRPVAKIVVHQQCYFAGETMNAFIATHNPGQLKP